ncbi:MAG: hypothetical protein QOJ54_592 [Aliidongia sp.]|jgi:hypothetical protein|nr:hypothetical protein [Aliidongia sp.]
MTIEKPYDSAGIEPDLIDLLADPVTHAVMRRDGVTLGDLCAVIRTGRRRLGNSLDPVPIPGRGRPAWRCPEEVRCA